MAERFPGFPPEGLRFFRNLARHNNREWFQANKHVFEEKVKSPMIELVEAVNEELLAFAPEHVTDPREAIYRIYRDTRFSPDKTPYKTHIAANFPRRGFEKHKAAGYYFGISATEVEIAGGVYMPGPEELLAIRSFLAENYEEFRQVISAKSLRALMGKLTGEQLQRPPKGFAGGHPAEDLLRRKQWYFYVTLPPELATTPRLLPELVRRFRALGPFIELLNRPLLERRRSARAERAATTLTPAGRRRGL
jgi:uncharacterized protein (TIGR02453 family)